MKVAIFTDAYLPFTSGVVTHIRVLKEELERNGHQALVITANPNIKDYELKDNVLYCPSHALKKIYGYGITNPISFQRLHIIKDFDPDIIHIHTEFSMGIFGLWAAKMMNKPIVYTLHTMYDDYTGYVFPKQLDGIGQIAAHRYFRIIANRADEIIGPSPKVGSFLERCGVYRDIHVVSNIADPEAENEKDEGTLEDIKDKYNLNESEAVLCFVGRLGKEKSIDVLITFLADVVKKHPTVKLFVIGGGPEEESLKGLTKELGLTENVIFTGMIPNKDVMTYMDACDLYATASTSEMNSVSMLEALSRGLMVVQRLDEVNRYQISEGKTGWIFETKEDFVSLIDEYINKSPEEKQEIRSMVIENAEAHGSKEFMTEVLNIYNAAIAEHKGTSGLFGSLLNKLDI